MSIVTDVKLFFVENFKIITINKTFYAKAFSVIIYGAPKRTII